MLNQLTIVSRFFLMYINTDQILVEQSSFATTFRHNEKATEVSERLKMPMPSSPSRPYKSKLFNFVNRQSLELRDNLVRVVRHLRVMAEWGTQIFVYPLYLFVQASRTVRRQLGQTVEEICLSSEEISSFPLNSDRPLNKVLQKIEPWLDSSEFLLGKEVTQTETDSGNLARKFTIKGIASVLDSSCLVLVKSNNQTVDLLSPSQQKILQKLIQVETANYCYDRRFKLAQSRKTPGLISNFSTNSQNVLPPVRWFWQRMRWMQTSPIATRLNLFGESFLRVRIEHQLVSSVVKQSSNFNVEHLKNFTQTGTDYFHRKSQSKKLFSETNQLINICSIGKLKRSSSLQKRPELFEYNIISSSVKIIKKIRKKLQQSIKSSLIEEKNNPFQLKIFIFAAIDYLLGKKTSNLRLKPKQSIKTIKSNFLFPNFGPHKYELINEDLDDLWLSWDDLYAEEKTSNSLKNLTDPPMALSRAYKEETNLDKSLKEDIKVLLKHQNKRRENKKNKKLKPVAISVSDVKPKQDFIGIIQSTYPAVIETEAKSTGYVKHPLENILGWLDMIISWLERLGSKLWEALRKLTK
ncbi:hypothetical protein ETSB_1257 [cyanobacterium endosymbiont of Epithemia turgida isolate EtSB Lake Yunoko]|nr:hypothetical protein ETSB_1257 [cyanobacterium endosymbiont of Epithemia turgida isolate EtSB Lake Yunoko]